MAFQEKILGTNSGDRYFKAWTTGSILIWNGKVSRNHAELRLGGRNNGTNPKIEK